MEAPLRLWSIAFSIACLACMAGGYGRARESYKITLLSKLITRVVKKAYRSLVAKVSRIHKQICKLWTMRNQCPFLGGEIVLTTGYITIKGAKNRPNLGRSFYKVVQKHPCQILKIFLKNVQQPRLINAVVTSHVTKIIYSSALPWVAL